MVPLENGQFRPKHNDTCFFEGSRGTSPDEPCMSLSNKLLLGKRDDILGGTSGAGPNINSAPGASSSKCFSCSSYCFASPDGYDPEWIRVRIVSESVLRWVDASGQIVVRGMKEMRVTPRLKSPWPEELDDSRFDCNSGRREEKEGCRRTAKRDGAELLLD